MLHTSRFILVDNIYWKGFNKNGIIETIKYHFMLLIKH